MKWTFGNNMESFEILNWRSVSSATTLKEFRDGSSALMFLRRFMHDPFAMMAFREFVLEQSHSPGISRMNDEEVIEQLAWQLASGGAWIAASPVRILTLDSQSSTEIRAPEPKPEPEPRPEPRPVALEEEGEIELVEFKEVDHGNNDVARNRQEGVYRQYVNLAKNLGQQFHHENAASIRLMGRVKWTDDSITTSLAGQKVRFSGEINKRETMIEPANAEGKAYCTFRFSKFSGDKFAMKAQALVKDTDEPTGDERELGDYQVWRKIWYQRTEDAVLNVPSIDPTIDEYKRLYVEFCPGDPEVVHYRRGQVQEGGEPVNKVLFQLPNAQEDELTPEEACYYPSWMIDKNGNDDYLPIVGGYNSPDFDKAFVSEDDKPVKAHVIFCKGFWKPAMHSPLVEATIRTNEWVNIPVPLENNEQAVLDPPILYGSLLGGPVSLTFDGKEHAAGWMEIQVARDRPGLNYIRVRLPADRIQLSRRYPAKIRFRVNLAQHSCGISGGNKIIIGVEDGDEQQINDTLMHEVGHGLNQTPLPGRQPDGLPDHPYQHGNEHGGNGSHCSKDAKKKGKGTSFVYKDGTCIMLFYQSEECRHRFCSECSLYLSLEEMSRFHIPG
jgi:hypothetical protein